MRQLLALRELARTQSFTRAAARLNTTQSNLSLAVREAEALLGARLFNRTTKSFALTVLGEQFLPVVERVLLDLQRGIENIEASVQLQRGVLSLGAAPLLAAGYLPPLLAEYRRAHPRVDLRIEDSSTAEHSKLLRAGQIELAVGTYSENDTDLATHELIKVPLIAFIHRTLSPPKTLRWQDVEPERMVAIERHSSVGQLIEKTIWQVQKRLYEPALQCHNFATVLAMAEALQTACIAPSHAVPTDRYLDLVRVPLVAPVVSRTLSIAHRRDNALSPAAQAFVDQLLA